MPLKTNIYGANKKKGPLQLEASDLGALAIVMQNGLFENYFHDKTTITTGTPAIYDYTDKIGRQCTGGYISNDDAVGGKELEVTINNNATKIWIQPQEKLDMTGSNARIVIIESSGTSIPFRILMK